MDIKLISLLSIATGTIISLITYKWDFYDLSNPNYFKFKGRSETTQEIIRLVNGLFRIIGGGLIIFSYGFKLKPIIFGVIFLLSLYILFFPLIIKGKLKKSKNKQ